MQAPAELDAIVELLHGVEERYAGGIDSTRGEVASMVAGPDVRREESVVVLGPTGQLAGLGWYEVDETGQEIWAESYAAVSLPEAGAVQQALVAHGLELAHAIVGERAGWKLRSGTYEREDGYRQTLQSHGFHEVRRFWRMEVASTSPEVPAHAPALPAGVTIESGDGEEHKRALYEVDQAAFADHWNFTPRSYEESWKHILGEPGARPEYWWLLRVDGAPAALCVLNESRLELGYAYVSILGVLREFRGRGLARLLLRTAFVQARDMGLAGTALHVDSQNPTGATALYRSVGMTPAQVYVAFERALP